jgi:predicted alpha/beta hydrolase
MKTFSVQTPDNYTLTASVFEPKTSNGQAILINAAMAVPQRYYLDFATYLAENGFFVYTYDYRGTGLSREGSLKGFEATMTTWATSDYPTMFHFISKQHPEAKISVVGHSFGGNCLGQNAVSQQLDKIVLVGSQHGYFGLFWTNKKPLLFFLWYILMPFLTKTYGYFPSKLIGMGEELPKGVALQWARICRNPHWFFAYLSSDENLYANIKAKMLVISIEDDWYAPKKAVDKLLNDGYKNAQIDRKHILPAEVPAKAIGHFGFFRNKFKDNLWKMVLEYLK